MDALPIWSIPGHDSTKFPWRAPGDVDRALPGAAARRLYVPPPLHESCRKGDADDVRARLDAGADVNEKDGVRVKSTQRQWLRALATTTGGLNLN